MCAGTEDINQDGTDNLVTNIGIAGNHAYSLMACYSLVFEDGQWRIFDEKNEEPDGRSVERLLKLRNPWGQREWQHAWSDGSQEWLTVPDSLKEHFGYKEGDDGMFFIRMQDFEKYFSDFTICHYHDDYKLSTFKFITEVDEVKDCEFEIYQETNVYFSLQQVNKRMWRKSEGYKYSQC